MNIPPARRQLDLTSRNRSTYTPTSARAWLSTLQKLEIELNCSGDAFLFAEEVGRKPSTLLMTLGDATLWLKDNGSPEEKQWAKTFKETISLRREADGIRLLSKGPKVVVPRKNDRPGVTSPSSHTVYQTVIEWWEAAVDGDILDLRGKVYMDKKLEEFLYKLASQSVSSELEIKPDGFRLMK